MLHRDTVDLVRMLYRAVAESSANYFLRTADPSAL